jgi:acyl carrier protein phosphodiesterase
LNYLVHLYLAGADPGLQLGSMMGDFVKGPIPAGYPDTVRLGVQLHRKIDSLAQTNVHCRTSRRRLHNRYGHVRSVMVDIFYDHFLASDWSDYHADSLEAFAADFYRTLDEYRRWLPEGLARTVPRMKQRNWLVAYRDKASVERALLHLASRLSRPTPLGEGLEELYRHEAMLKGDFHGFMQDAGLFSERFLGGRG